MRRKWLAGILIMAVCLLGSSVAFAKVSLRHWHNELGPLKQVTDTALAERFMQLYPEVKIEVEAIPGGLMEEKTVTAIMADATPNTERDYFGRLAAWGYQGLLVNLNGTLSQEDLDDFYPGILASFFIDGELIGYPTCFWLQPFLANKTILDKAGVVFPEGSWTIAEWTELAKKVKAMGVWPAHFFANTEQGDYLTLMWLSIGGGLLWQDEDYTRTVLNSPENIQALEWMLGLVEEGYAPPGTAGRGIHEYLNMVYAGKVATAPMIIRAATLDQQQSMVDQGMVSELQDIRVVETPRLTDSAIPKVPFGPSGVVVFQKDNSEEVRWSIEWIKFITSKENIDFDAIAGAQFSARRSVNPHTDSLPHTRLLEIVAANGTYDLGVGSPQYLACRHALVPELQAAFLGAKTAQEALDDFAEVVVALWK